MDESELQALLEEAMNYKKPSDIETKSECFKVTPPLPASHKQTHDKFYLSKKKRKRKNEN